MTWFAEVVLVPAALLLSGSPPVERLRLALAERWDVPAERVAIEADSTALALLARARDLHITRVLAGGRIMFADASLQRARVRAGSRANVPVAAADLARGTLLDSAAVALREHITWGGVAPGSIIPIGWITTRALRAGDPLVPPAVAAPIAVRAGEEVRAVWQRGGIRLELVARAAGTGAVGDTVAVRTVNGRRLEGVITAPRELVLVGSEGKS